MLEFLSLLIIFGGALYFLGTWVMSRFDNQCQKYKYLYRTQPRTFVEQQQEPDSVFAMYKDLFWKVSPVTSKWSGTARGEIQNGSINPFILGELPETPIGTVRESNDFLNLPG
jgi:hypothetical protein